MAERKSGNQFAPLVGHKLPFSAALIARGAARTSARSASYANRLLPAHLTPRLGRAGNLEAAFALQGAARFASASNWQA